MDRTSRVIHGRWHPAHRATRQFGQNRGAGFGVFTSPWAFDMRIPIIVILFIGLAAGNASALSIDAKALARYDVSYVECEARIPAMKGRRDEAYLNLWRIRADEKALARLASVRKGSAYQAERQRVLRAPARAASAASSVVAQQCQGLWAETQRTAIPKTDVKPDKGP
jgi:hypothetical protein